MEDMIFRLLQNKEFVKYVNSLPKNSNCFDNCIPYDHGCTCLDELYFIGDKVFGHNIHTKNSLRRNADIAVRKAFEKINQTT